MIKKLEFIDVCERVFVSTCVLFTFYGFLLIYANIKHDEIKKHSPTEKLIEMEIQHEKLESFNHLVQK